MNRLRSLLAAVTVATVTAAVLVPAAASAAEPQPGRALGTVDTLDDQRPALASAATGAPSPQSCDRTPAGSRERRAGATVMCVSTTPGTAGSDQGSERGPDQATVLDETTCSVTGQGEIRYHRFGSCAKSTIVITLFNDKGVVLGTGTLNVVNSMTLKNNSTTWDELITVTLVAVTNQVTAVSVALDAGCTSSCSMSDATPWTGSRTLTRGQSASGTVTYSDPLAKGAQDTLRSQYHAYVTIPGAIPAQPNADWDGVLDIRCDNAVGNSAGCVYPAARAEFLVSLATYGAAAVTYWWAQSALPDSWGDQTPLRRLADESAAQANRRRTCDSTFVPFSDDIVVDDSCDEFPFAATYEGGTAGVLCADIVPLFEDGQWTIYEADPNKPVTLNEPCVRGHVPEGENEGAGGELGRFAQRERVLDLEKYSMYVVN